MVYKVALIIPTTSNGRNWINIEESYLCNFFLKSFKETYNNELEYTLYIGYDNDDKIYSKKSELEKLNKIVGCLKNVTLITVPFNIEKGHVTLMWNVLFKMAYDNGIEYFFQFGDDIYYHKKHWDMAMITELNLHNNFGVVGPQNVNGNTKILTQSGVSRKHYELFQYYFPPEIKNSHCDDWINMIYSPKYLYILKDYTISNMSGQRPRYRIDLGWRSSLNILVNNSKKMIETYIESEGN